MGGVIVEMVLYRELFAEQDSAQVLIYLLVVKGRRYEIHKEVRAHCVALGRGSGKGVCRAPQH
jgi:hypothetical protein